ncbi:MAG: signal peptidase I [Fusobacteriaceae bacterium]|jgi:signal peptidase I|nr:signal peptidase I [Fusobacteriaceae bacterium]
MDKNKLFINIILYVILSIFLLYVLIKEDKVTKIIEIKREKIVNIMINRFKITKEKTKIVFKNTIWLIEFICSTAILLILIRTFYLGNFVVPTGSMIPAILENDRLFANMAIYRFRKPKLQEIFLFREPVTNKDLYTKRVMGLPGDKVFIIGDFLYVNDKKIENRKYINAGKLGYDTWIVPKKGDVIEIVPKMDYVKYLKNSQINIDEIQKYLINNLIELDKILPDIEIKVNGKKTGMILDFLHEKEHLDKLMKGKVVTLVSKKDYYLALGDNTRNSFDSRMWGFVSEDRIKGKPLFRFWPLNRVGFLK